MAHIPCKRPPSVCYSVCSSASAIKPSLPCPDRPEPCFRECIKGVQPTSGATMVDREGSQEKWDSLKEGESWGIRPGLKCLPTSARWQVSLLPSLEDSGPFIKKPEDLTLIYSVCLAGTNADFPAPTPLALRTSSHLLLPFILPYDWSPLGGLKELAEDPQGARKLGHTSSSSHLSLADGGFRRRRC